MPVATRNDCLLNIGQGSGYLYATTSNSPAAQTAAAAGSGFFNMQLFFNSVGTTAPSTLVGFPLPAGLSNELMLLCAAFASNSAASRACWLAYLYQIGTVNLAATGNQFTHETATFPLLRTEFGVANTAISLIPLLYITTATTITAPAFILRTDAGGAGYTDQDGNSVTGTITFTCPAAATAAQSCYVLRLEDGDSAVQDITQVDVETAGTAGAGTIFGMEILGTMTTPLTNVAGVYDALHGGISLQNLRPATATSGTVTAYLVAVMPQSAAQTIEIIFWGTHNVTPT